MGSERLVAGVFAGVGALVLLYKGESATAVALLSGMLAFFVGESNGKRKAEGH